MSEREMSAPLPRPRRPRVWVASSMAATAPLLAELEQAVRRAGMEPKALDFSGGWPADGAIEAALQAAADCHVFVDAAPGAYEIDADRRALSELEQSQIPSQLRIELKGRSPAKPDRTPSNIEDLGQELFLALKAWKTPPAADPSPQNLPTLVQQIDLHLKATRGRLPVPELRHILAADPPIESCWRPAYGSLRRLSQASTMGNQLWQRPDRQLELSVLQLPGELEHSEAKALYISGPRGSGKTACLLGLQSRYCQRDAAANNMGPRACGFIDLTEQGQLPTDNEGLEAWIRRCGHRWFGQASRQPSVACEGRDYPKLLAQRAVLLFVDGLDGLSLDQASLLQSHLGQLLNEAHDARAFVSLAPAQLPLIRSTGPEPWVFVLHPPSQDRAHDISLAWFETCQRGSHPEEAEDLDRALWRALRLAESTHAGFIAATRQPDVLSLLCAVIEREGPLQQYGAVELVDGMIDGLLQRWTETEHAPRDWAELLAWHCFELHGHGTIEAQALGDFIEQHFEIAGQLPVDSELWRAIHAGRGLLRVDEHGRIRFVNHLCFARLAAAGALRASDFEPHQAPLQCIERLRTRLVTDLDHATELPLSFQVAAWLTTLASPEHLAHWLQQCTDQLGRPGISALLESAINRAPEQLGRQLASNCARALIADSSDNLDITAPLELLARAAGPWFAKLRCLVGRHARAEIRRILGDVPGADEDYMHDPITGLEFARIPAGSYVMGTPGGHIDERPGAPLQLDEFFMARTPVTNAQFDRFLAEHPNHPRPPLWPGILRDRPNHPVVDIDFHTAQAFCHWAGYELPTEAQWEYARCLGGATMLLDEADPDSPTRWRTRGRSTPLNEIDAPQRRSRRVTAELSSSQHSESGTCSAAVGESVSNALGLFDLSGYVWQWCRDAFDVRAYARPQLDGSGLRRNDDGPFRVLRGAAHSSAAHERRPTYRYAQRPETRASNIGFRPIVATTRQGATTAGDRAPDAKMIVGSEAAA